jgi:hypothetical protein
VQALSGAVSVLAKPTAQKRSKYHRVRTLNHPKAKIAAKSTIKCRWTTGE